MISSDLQSAIDIVDYAYNIGDAFRDNDRIRKAYVTLKNSTNDQAVSSILRLQGVFQFLLDRKEEAAVSFDRAGDYESAMAATAQQKRLFEYASHALKKGQYSRYAIQVLLNDIPGSVSVFRSIMEGIHGFDSNIRDLFTAAAIVWKDNCGMGFEYQWPDRETFFCLQNLNYLKKLYNSDVGTKKSNTAVVDADKAVISKAKEKTVAIRPVTYCGNVKSYMESKRCGFIGDHDVPPQIYNGDLFFYMGQVNDNELRKRLYDLSAIGLRVTFSIGINPRNQKPSADNIQISSELSENVTIEQSTIREGSIIEYDKFEQHGKILYNSTEISFRIGNVKDPMLKAYLTANIEAPDCKVKFLTVNKANGKRYASQIIALEQFPDTLIEKWVQDKILSEMEMKKWKDKPAPVIIDSLPGHLGIYQPLEPYEKENSRNIKRNVYNEPVQELARLSRSSWGDFLYSGSRRFSRYSLALR